VALNDIDTGPGQQRRIALVAHDGRKQDMREWAEFNRDVLACHQLYATGSTGRMLSEELGLPVTRFHSGPSAGDQPAAAGD
jgi:methylglyoxal synthase